MNALLIEESSGQNFFIRSLCEAAFSGKLYLESVHCLELGVQKLREGRFDVCLCSLSLLHTSLDEALDKLRYLKINTAMVVLTDIYDIDVARKLITKGVQDYLPKSGLSKSQIYRSVHYAIARKSVQSKLEEQNTDMRAFCHSLSHDFKAPIRRIRQLLDFLEQDITQRVELTEEEMSYIRHTQTCSKDITSLVDSLHRYLTIEDIKNNLSKINLVDLLLRVEAIIQNSLSQPFKLVVSELPVLEGVESQLQLVFQNLILNAIKHNRNSPTIHISSELNLSGDRCLVYVKDNGIGIDKKYDKTIFEPFTRISSETSGSGLGLNLVKRVMEKHGGTIRLGDSSDKGSCFILDFPLSQRVKTEST